MEQLNKYVEENNRVINQQVRGYSPQPAVAAASSTGSSTAAAKTAVQAESTQRNQQGGPNLEEQKQNLSEKIRNNLVDLDKDITRKKEIYKGDGNMSKKKELAEIESFYENTVNRAQIFLKDVESAGNTEMGKLNKIYEKTFKPNFLEPLKQKLGDLEINGSPGDGGVNGNKSGSDESDQSASGPPRAAEAQGDAAAERKKEAVKIEADIKKRLVLGLEEIQDKNLFTTLVAKKQWLYKKFILPENKSNYLPNDFVGKEWDPKGIPIDTKFYATKQLDIPKSVLIYNKLQQQTTEDDFEKIADVYTSSAASTLPNSSDSPALQVNDNLNPTSNNQSSSGPPLHSQDLGRLKGAQAAEIKLLEKKLANMNTQKESAKQAAQDKQTEIKEALEKMLKSLKKRLEQEKLNVSEEVNKTINDKILQVERFIKKPDLDIKVLTNVEKINEEIETAKWKHEFSANGVKELCESLQELMRQLTRHSRPPLTGGRKTRNKKKKKKSKAKKNKTRRRRRRSKA